MAKRAFRCERPVLVNPKWSPPDDGLSDVIRASARRDTDAGFLTSSISPRNQCQRLSKSRQVGRASGHRLTNRRQRSGPTSDRRMSTAPDGGRRCGHSRAIPLRLQAYQPVRLTIRPDPSSFSEKTAA